MKSKHQIKIENGVKHSSSESVETPNYEMLKAHVYRSVTELLKMNKLPPLIGKSNQCDLMNSTIQRLYNEQIERSKKYNDLILKLNCSLKVLFSGRARDMDIFGRPSEKDIRKERAFFHNILHICLINLIKVDINYIMNMTINDEKFK